MRHRKINKRVGRSKSHRRALYSSLAMALLENGRITTTDAKAKTLRSTAEKLITLGKRGTLDARRLAYAELGGAGKHPRPGEGPHRVQRVVSALFGDLAQRMKDRKGGYTRIVKLSTPRHGDAAPMSIIELVDYEPPEDTADE
jgi:large subunit ribosomal protein L17